MPFSQIKSVLTCIMSSQCIHTQKRTIKHIKCWIWIHTIICWYFSILRTKIRQKLSNTHAQFDNFFIYAWVCVFDNFCLIFVLNMEKYQRKKYQQTGSPCSHLPSLFRENFRHCQSSLCRRGTHWMTLVDPKFISLTTI